jgi:hypothetical protein
MAHVEGSGTTAETVTVDMLAPRIHRRFDYRRSPRQLGKWSAGQFDADDLSIAFDARGLTYRRKGNTPGFDDVRLKGRRDD